MTTTIVDREVSVRGSPPIEQSFLLEVDKSTSNGGSRLMHCIQCGTCGGSCPSILDMEHTPRQLFAMIENGKREEVLRSNTFWYCVSCYHCVVRCPREVKITDTMYTLKRKAIREGFYRENEGQEASGFAGYFMDNVEEYGRSFELGVASRFTLRYRPLKTMKMAPLGLGMLRKGRMDLIPKRIKNIKQLKAIINKARELGESS